MKKLLIALVLTIAVASVNAQDSTKVAKDTTKPEMFFLQADFGTYVELEKALEQSDYSHRTTEALLGWIRQQIKTQVDAKSKQVPAATKPKK